MALRFKLWHKLLATGVALVVPTAALVVSYVNDAARDIRFTREEQCGLDYLRVLRTLHEAATAGRVAEVETRLGELDALEGRACAGGTYREDLKTDGALAHLRQSWTRADPDRVEWRAAVLRLFAHVGDQSNLILDPDLDTYYVMDFLVNHFPEGASILSRHDGLSQRDRDATGVYLRRQLEVLDRRLQVAYANNDYHGASRHTLKPALGGPAEHYRRVTAGVLEAPADAATAAGEALASLYRLYDLADRWESGALQARIDDRAVARNRTIALTVALVVLALLVMLMLVRGTVTRLAHLKRAAHRMASGQLAERVALPGHDEISELGRAFDHMAAELHGFNRAIEQREQILLKISQRPVVDAGDLPETCRLVTEASCAALRVPRASIWLWDEARAAIVCQLLLDQRTGYSAEPVRLERREFPAYFSALDSGRTINANDAHTDPRTAEFSKPYLTPLGIHAMLDVTIRQGGRMVGVLCCEDVAGPRAWSESDAAFGSAMADMVGRALVARERVRSDQAFRELNATLEARVAQRTVDLDAALKTAEDSDARFRALADAVDVVFWIGEPDFSGWRYANPAFERLWGWSVPELMQKPELFIGSVLPEDLPTVTEAMRAAGAGGEANIEYRIRTRSGELRWVWSKAYAARDAQGRVMFTAGTTTDITQRKNLEARLQQSEREARETAQRLRGLTDNCPGLLLEGRRESPEAPVRFTYVSAGAEEFYHPHKAEDIVRDSRAILEAVHPEDRQRLIGELNRTSAGRELNFMAEYRTRRPDGSYRWIQSVSAQIPDASGPGVTHYGFAADIQVQKALQESLAAARIQADSANQAKSAFLATMSHEIRTPMIGVTGMLEVLSHTHLNEEQCRAVSVIQQSADTLLQIIGDTLDFSKIEAGKLELAPATVSLRTLVEWVAQNFTPPASSKGLYLRCHVDPALALAHVADPVRMRQILGNFISNALKFTEKGGIEVVVRVLEDAASTQHVELAVSDTGIGVSDDNQRRLFEPFAQAESSTTRRFGGTGLGLSICRRLAHLMGGEVTMRSRLGQGTVLYLRCRLERGDPARIEATAPVASKAAGRPRPTRERALAEGSLLLLVEDHPTNRMVLRQQFELAGFVIDVAEDGGQGLRMWRETPYGLVFTDLHMPNMDGIQLTRAIREAEPTAPRRRTPILALTAAALKEETERCLKAGMDDVVIKPTTVPVLASKLRQWLPQLAWDTPALAGDAERHGGVDDRRTITLPVLDRAVLEGLTGGNAELKRSIVEDFRQSTEADLAALAESVGRRDADQVRRQAHRIGGACRAVGAMLLARDSSELEAAGRRADWGGIRKLTGRMKRGFGRVQRELHKSP